jgi:hypothetical protein
MYVALVGLIIILTSESDLGNGVTLETKYDISIIEIGHSLNANLANCHWRWQTNLKKFK